MAIVEDGRSHSNDRIAETVDLAHGFDRFPAPSAHGLSCLYPVDGVHGQGEVYLAGGMIGTGKPRSRTYSRRLGAA